MRVPSLWKPSPRGGEQQSCEMQSCTPAHFRVKAAARREIRQFNISDEPERGGKRRKEIQKPWVFGGVLSPISFAAERNETGGGSDPSAAGGGQSEVSEWPRSKFQAVAVRQRRNFGHRNSDHLCAKVLKPQVSSSPFAAAGKSGSLRSAKRPLPLLKETRPAEGISLHKSIRARGHGCFLQAVLRAMGSGRSAAGPVRPGCRPDPSGPWSER